MITTTLEKRDACAAMADLFDIEFAGHAPQIARDIAASLDPRYSAAVSSLEAFASETEDYSPKLLQEAFSRTYDLNPSCAPYLSVHLFGEESFKRAILMTGLAASYEKAGVERGTELTDHIAVVLRFATRFDDEEWNDIARYCLPTPLVRMSALLDPPKNPHRHIAAALQGILHADFNMDTPSCSTSSSSQPFLTSPCSSCSLAPTGATEPTGSATLPCHHSSSKTGSSCGVPSPGTSGS